MRNDIIGTIGWFSIECRKTKVIALANHNKNKQFNEPISNRVSVTRRGYMGREELIPQMPLKLMLINDFEAR